MEKDNNYALLEREVRLLKYEEPNQYPSEGGNPKISLLYSNESGKRKNNETYVSLPDRKKPDHQPQGRVFLTISIISLYQSMKKPLIVSYYDVSKFFDQENLRDVMSKIHTLGINVKLYRILLKKFTKVKNKPSSAMKG